MGISTKTKIVALALVSLLIVNLFWSYINYHGSNQNNSADNSISAANLQAKYPLLSKRIFADNPSDILINFVALRKEIAKKFDTLPNGTKYSFYFEYLPSGTSIRDGSDNTLVAASLIKVPLVMNLYKASELGRVDLDKEVVITKNELDAEFGDLWKKGEGTKITLREAARLTLSESDNTAMRVIFKATNGLLNPDEESLNNLDIDQNMEQGRAVIDAKSYTSVLKSLFLASYVSRDSSQEILTSLSKSTAKNRLAAQLPTDLMVAHKIGVYNSLQSESDCGIVYVPLRPYALCVMVTMPEKDADAFIADISKKVYDYIVRQ